MADNHHYFVYIMLSRLGTTLYVGITNSLSRRVNEHRSGTGSAFTRRYRVHRLVYYEPFDDVKKAIAREKEIKAWRQEKKERLIRSVNPQLFDLTEQAMLHGL